MGIEAFSNEKKPPKVKKHKDMEDFNKEDCEDEFEGKLISVLDYLNTTRRESGEFKIKVKKLKETIINLKVQF